MRRVSKGDRVLELFFNEPTRHWHFEEILIEAGLSRKPLSRWLSILLSEKLIHRVKPRGKMPFYTANYALSPYQVRKRIFAMEMLEKSGLAQKLSALPNAKTAIIFGSMTRWDWHKESDIDLFIYGDAKGLELGEVERRLGRDIEVFECKDKESLSRLGEGLLKNIIHGDIIKGGLDFVKVSVDG
ncbi:MAG: nucleotidyltransferase domain-containing protein [Nanoarchaeota archaeon]